MRRFSVVIGLLVLVVALPGSALGARPTRFTDTTVHIDCDVLSAVEGAGSALFSAALSDRTGPDGYVAYWPTTTPSGRPAIERDFEAAPVITWDGNVLAGSIPVRDSAGNPAAPATFSATLAPSGDPVPFDDTFKDGNTRHRFVGTDQPMDPSGTLQIGGASFSLDGCFAGVTTVTVFETNPNSFVARFAERTVGCELRNTAGDTGFLFVDVHESAAFISAFVDPVAGATLEAFAEGAIVDGVLDTPLQVVPHDTGEPAGTGSISLAISSVGEPFEYLLRNATARLKASGTAFDVEGSLIVAGHVFDLGACVLADGTTKVIQTNPRGPKPTGKAPANDLPSGAKLLRVGDRTSVATKSASPVREATFVCEIFEDPNTGLPVEVPVGNTVWYRIVGTGGPITIDTAGSDYDTVIAVYTADGSGGFTPVPGACVDDVPLDPVGRTLQASVTFNSIAGVTYYVQIGGFPESFTYGNLRVRVS